jgi:hypothetical protein
LGALLAEGSILRPAAEGDAQSGGCLEGIFFFSGSLCCWRICGWLRRRFGSGFLQPHRWGAVSRAWLRPFRLRSRFHFGVGIGIKRAEGF